MHDKLTLVMLPGLDGSGVLFEPLLALLPPEISVQVIRLSDFPSEDRAAQAQFLAERLGEAPCVIFAESYSGRLAYELALLPKVNIRHIIFVGSFLASPSRQSRRAHWLPAGLLKSRFILWRLLSYFLFHQYRPDLLALLSCAMANQSSVRLKQRLVNLADAQNPDKPISVACTYLQAKEDRLVDTTALVGIRAVCISLDVVQVEGGHFIAQTEPQLCRDIILDRINNSPLAPQPK
ncbi:MAG TPA: alpha/beta hydrolase [Cellvibrionaceae bacterium]